MFGRLKQKNLQSHIIGQIQVLKVLEAGIEPAHPKILDFESSASTSSATRASGGQNYKKFSHSPL